MFMRIHCTSINIKHDIKAEVLIQTRSKLHSQRNKPRLCLRSDLFCWSRPVARIPLAADQHLSVVQQFSEESRNNIKWLNKYSPKIKYLDLCSNIIRNHTTLPAVLLTSSSSSAPVLVFLCEPPRVQSQVPLSFSFYVLPLGHIIVNTVVPSTAFWLH